MGAVREREVVFEPSLYDQTAGGLDKMEGDALLSFAQPNASGQDHPRPRGFSDLLPVRRGQRTGEILWLPDGRAEIHTIGLLQGIAEGARDRESGRRGRRKSVQIFERS